MAAVFRASRSTGTARRRARASQFPISTQIPLSGVKPGTYRLRVEARVVGATDIKPAVRETALTVQ
jgi:hypothetical protein